MTSTNVVCGTHLETLVRMFQLVKSHAQQLILEMWTEKNDADSQKCLLQLGAKNKHQLLQRLAEGTS
jgi:hypothetical protein